MAGADASAASLGTKTGGAHDEPTTAIAATPPCDDALAPARYIRRALLDNQATMPLPCAIDKGPHPFTSDHSRKWPFQRGTVTTVPLTLIAIDCAS